MVSLYTLIGLLPWSSPSGSQFLLICGKPRFALLPPMSHTLPRLVLRFAQSSCAGQEERTVAPHCRRSATRFTLTLCSGRCPRPLLAVRGQISVRRRAPHAVSIAPPTAPDVGGVQDRLGLSAMSCRYGHRLTAHLQSGIGLLRRADTRHLPPPYPRIRLFRSFPFRPAPQSGGESACACGLWLDTDGVAEAHTAAYVAIGCRCGEASRYPIGFYYVCPMLSQGCSATPVSGQWHTLRRQSAGSSFPFLQAQCFAAGASRVVGGVSLPEVLHYAHRTPSASPPFEHSPTSPNHEITTSELAVISSADRQSGAFTAHNC